MPSAPAPGPAPASAPRVTLISRPGCHLCNDARAIITSVTEELGETFEELSVLEHPNLMEKYAEEIPVTLVDGKQHDFWRVNETRLRAALTQTPR